MKTLTEINDQFIDEYIFAHRNNLSKPTMGGTDWRFADIVAPAFKEILEITNADSVLEIGFNVGGSALMFLKINPNLIYHSIDIAPNKKSINFLTNEFAGFKFSHCDSWWMSAGSDGLNRQYDMIFIDGNHAAEAVVSDIERSFSFEPKYLLLDDYKHPSHGYIEKIVTETYSEKLEVVKVFEFNQCWQGYSFALCKIKN